MAISFDKAFGVHPHAMLIRSQRAELLATNIANADTPGYKAKDVDFASALKAAKSNQQAAILWYVQTRNTLRVVVLLVTQKCFARQIKQIQVMVIPLIYKWNETCMYKTH